jgi:hypothetical protein
MNPPPEPRPSEATIGVYEQLRERMLDPHHRITGELGLNVLLRHGMLAWSRTTSPLLIEACVSPTSLDTTRISAPLHEEIIDLMVTMAICLSRSLHPGALAP